MASYGLFGQPGPATSFGASAANVDLPRVTTGTSTPAYASFGDKDPWVGSILHYQAISATPAYRGMSLEELRVQDYYPAPVKTGTSTPFNQTSSVAPAAATTSPFGAPGAPESDQQRLASTFGGNPAFVKPAAGPSPGTISASGQPNPALGFGSTFGQSNDQQNHKTADAFDHRSFVPVWDQQRPTGAFASTSIAFGNSSPAEGFRSAFQPTRCTASPMADPSKQEHMEEFIKRFLLGEELVNTRFHIFSARSSSSGRVTKSRVLCANSLLLANNSKYFLNLLSSDIDPSDPSLTELADDDQVPSDVRISDYGYESDSDLDECDDPIPETSKVRSATSLSKPATEHLPQYDDESESVDSDVFEVNSVQSRTDEYSHVDEDKAKVLMDYKTTAQEPLDSEILVKPAETRLRSSGSRHILVKDAAFQTWYTLLNYLSTGKISFLPLSSATPSKGPRGFPYSPGEPKCSAKSVYRLASKFGLNDLRDLALAHIRSNLEDHNILDEILCSLVMSHPQLLDMELDVLFSCIATPPVVANFPTLLRRIANKELPHGAEILVIMHSRFLKALHPCAPSFALTPSPLDPFPPSASASRAPPVPTTVRQEPHDTICKGSEEPHSQSPEALTVNESWKKGGATFGKKKKNKNR